MNPVIQLQPADAPRYLRLRETMLRDTPWAFDASPGDDYAGDATRVAEFLAEPFNSIFAVALDEYDASSDLVASAGIFRQKHIKLAHRAVLWGVYVHSHHRKNGLGRAVVNAAINHARENWPGVDSISLGVSANSPAAIKLYESLGFTTWGREPDRVRIACKCYDEIHMLLKL